jgi:hypothetical protein
VIILLNQPRRRPLLSAFLAAGLTVSVGVGLALVFALHGAFHHGNNALSSGMDLTVGGLALLLAVALATRADARFAERRRSRRSAPTDVSARKGEPIMQRLLARESTPLVVLASLALNLPGAAYLVALKDISAAHYKTGTTIALVVVFNLIMFLLAEIPLAGLFLNPAGTEEAVLRVSRWFSAHGRQIAIVLCLILAVFLIVRGS